jgi:hypothetical protein
MPGARGIRDEMQKVSQPKSYGAPLGPAAPATGVNRPQVGAAPADVQRRAIAAHEAESARQARAGLYQKPLGSPAAPSQTLAPPNAQPAPSVFGAAQNIQARPAMIDQAVDATQK